MKFEKFYKIWFSNIAFIVFLILMTTLFFNLLTSNEDEFAYKMDRITQLDQITEQEFDELTNYFERFLVYFTTITIAFSLILFVGWAVFNIIDNNILHERNISGMNYKEVFFQIGNNVMFILMLMVATVLVVAASTLASFWYNPLTQIVYTAIVLIIAVYLMQYHYLFSFNSKIKGTIITIMTKKYFSWKNHLKLIGLLILFVGLYAGFGWLFTKYPNVRFDYFYLIFFIPAFISYSKLFVYEKVRK